MALNQKWSIIIIILLTSTISILATNLYYQSKINNLENKISGLSERIIKDEMQTTNFEGFENLETGFKERPDKTIEIPAENIIFDFEGTQSPIKNKVLRFGPLGIAPESPTDEPFYENYYSLELISKKKSDDVLEGAEKFYKDSLVIEPYLETINGYNVVIWSVGNLCESRFFEIIGGNKNILLFSNGCHTEAETDIDYFKKSILSTK